MKRPGQFAAETKRHRKRQRFFDKLAALRSGEIIWLTLPHPEKTGGIWRFKVGPAVGWYPELALFRSRGERSAFIAKPNIKDGKQYDVCGARFVYENRLEILGHVLDVRARRSAT